MMQNKFNWVRIGDYITLCDETNVSDHNYEVIGINREKEFMPTVANIESLDLRKYKIVRKGRFVFSGMQTGRDICIRIALYDKDIPALISPAYTTFTVNTPNELLPEFLFIYFLREEMDRYGWFISDSSVRANLDWNRFLDIRIPLPSIDEQKRIVETWKRLRMVKEQNEAIAGPLFQLCNSRLQELKHKYKLTEIGSYIEQCDERNSDDKYGVDFLRGVTNSGEFDKSKANTEGLKFTNYKVVKKCHFAYNPSRINIGSIALHNNELCIISPMYIVFRLNEKAKGVIIEEFMNLWFKRSEFQRSTLFYATGSVRDTFSFAEMKRVGIPIPPIEEQQAIVSIYKCVAECNRIAEEADKLSRELCPALIQKVIHA